MDRAELNRQTSRLRAQLTGGLAREVGAIDASQEPELVEECRLDFKRFCIEFFPTQVPRWHKAQNAMAEALQNVVLTGGLQALGLPRGSGKSTLARLACIWAVLYSHRQFVCLVGASQNAANAAIRNLKIMLTSSDRLAAAFPAQIAPLRHLNGVAQRGCGQTCDGKLTWLVWQADQIRLASIDGTPSDGQLLAARGLSAEIRGLSIADPKTGEIRRPDFVLCDDIQTSRSAGSVSQIAERREIIHNDILNLSGADKQIAGVVLCTVLQMHDLVDELLDSQKCPLWRGIRIELIQSWPANRDLWDSYIETYREGIASGRGRGEADTFFAANRQAMLEGFELSDHGSPAGITAEQFAFERFARDEAAFWAEMQLCPQGPAARDAAIGIRRVDLESALVPIDRGACPWRPWRTVCAIDVQSRVLYWLVAGCLQSGEIHIIDWGAWPQQTRRVFSSDSPNPAIPPGGTQQAIEDCIRYLRSRAFNCGADEFSPDLFAVDGGYLGGEVAAALHSLRTADNDLRKALILAKGCAPGPNQTPVDRYRSRTRHRKPVRKPGIMLEHTSYKIHSGDVPVRKLWRDANLSKSSIAVKARLKEGGSRLTISTPDFDLEREALFEQLLAEEPRLQVTPIGCHESWGLRPGSRDNHWLDALAMTRDMAVAFGQRDNVAAQARVEGDRREAERVAVESVPEGSKPVKRRSRQVVPLEGAGVDVLGDLARGLGL